MQRLTSRFRLHLSLVSLAMVGLVAALGAVAADAAKGTATLKTKSGPVTVTFAHAYLMKGPDVVTDKTIRRLVLSTADVAAALKACTSMSCSDGGIGEGMTVDFDAGPRLNYWFVAKGQLIQHSDTALPSEATLTVDTPTHIAGRLEFDDSPSGGATVNVEFDAVLVKELKK